MSCRKHVEGKTISNACIKFCKDALKKRRNEAISDVKMWNSKPEIANRTLCPIPHGSTYHNIKCLERVYESCRVDKLQLLPEELQMSEFYDGLAINMNLQENWLAISLVGKETSIVSSFHIVRGLLKTILTTRSWQSDNDSRWIVLLKTFLWNMQ